MKNMILVLTVFVSSFSYAAEEKIEEKKDFSIICAISKSAEVLSKDKYFTDKAERIALTSDIIEKNIKTDEVKNVMKAVSQSNPSEKIKMFKQAAKDVGLKKWNCPTLKFLY